MAATKPNQADKFEHIAAILTNVTQLKPGRALLLEPGRGFMEALAAQLKSSNLLRRQGCAAAFRNCCFSAEVQLPLHCAICCKSGSKPCSLLAVHLESTATGMQAFNIQSSGAHQVLFAARCGTDAVLQYQSSLFNLASIQVWVKYKFAGKLHP